MDKELPVEVVANKRKRTILIILFCTAMLVVAIWLLRSSFKSSLKAADTITSIDQIGTIENTINAAGEILPEFEQVITSPVNASIKMWYWMPALR